MVWLYWPSISFRGGKFLEIPTKFLRNWKSRLCKVLYFCQFVENESDSLSQNGTFLYDLWKETDCQGFSKVWPQYFRFQASLPLYIEEFQTPELSDKKNVKFCSINQTEKQWKKQTWKGLFFIGITNWVFNCQNKCPILWSSDLQFEKRLRKISQKIIKILFFWSLF